LTRTEGLKARRVAPGYYDAVAASAKIRPFPSPVNDPQWLASAAEWFSQGRCVLEVGPGRGEFAEAVIRRGGPERYYLADISQGMLDLVRERTSFESNVERMFLHADIDSDPLEAVLDGCLDRIIMINAFQDVDPKAVLKTFRRVVAPQGLLRVNVISREFREEFLSQDENFDRDQGHFYLTRSPAEGVEPLGFLRREGGEEVPYYRILKSYYSSDLKEIFQESGFGIVSAEPIILPREIWARTAAGKRAEPREEILRRFGGYPGSIDVISRPI
jgi:ubiquinone/menaquinone biosynthesis C-methylase UbiE